MSVDNRFLEGLLAVAQCCGVPDLAAQRLRSIALLSCFLLVACGGESGSANPDAGTGTDGGTDGGSDTGTGADGGSDTGTGADGGSDTGTGTDGGSDTGTGTDGGSVEQGLCRITMACSTAIVNDPKVPCTILVSDQSGNVEYDGWAGVELRGRSSLAFPKKQYAVELRVSGTDDNEAPVSLLGMGKESDWILNGSYLDRSFIRNKLLLELFQSMGDTDHYASEVAYCTMSLNGAPQGIYLLMEKMKRDNDRVAIQTDSAMDGSSFIVKQDDRNSDGFMDVGTANGRWSLIYPRQSRASATQIAGVTGWLAGWNDVVTGSDTTTELSSLVNLDNVVDFVIIEELAKNNDAYFLSMHVWKDRGGKLHFTPWDFDLSFGQPSYNNSGPPEGWVAYRPQMIRDMARSSGFQERLGTRWRALRAEILSDAAITARIDRYLGIVEPALEENFNLWPIDEVVFKADPELYQVSSHAEEMMRVRNWISARLAWMDENIDSYN